MLQMNKNLSKGLGIHLRIQNNVQTPPCLDHKKKPGSEALKSHSLGAETAHDLEDHQTHRQMFIS